MGNITFSLMTREHVMGVLEATESRGADALYAAQEGLVARVKPLNIFGICASSAVTAR